MKLQIRKFSILCTSILILNLPLNGYTWNATAHVVIAQIAYDQLDSEKKKKADELASIILNNLPEYQVQKLDHLYTNASAFAKVSVLPDVWRKWKVSTLFNKFGSLPPLNLILSMNKNTEKWHYIDHAYPDDKKCHTVESANAVWAINKLEQGFAGTHSLNSKAVQMVLLEHYIGDLHQPLHNITNVNEYCQGDRGGNDFCLKENSRGKCAKNLHSLWDSGLGYFNKHENIKNLAYELELTYPSSQFEKQLTNKNILSWSKENYALAPYIYTGIKQYELPNGDYLHNGQTIMKTQIVLAGYRLAEVLNSIL